MSPGKRILCVNLDPYPALRESMVKGSKGQCHESMFIAQHNQDCDTDFIEVSKIAGAYQGRFTEEVAWTQRHDGAE